MADNGKAGSTTQTGNSRNRFIVSLPQEVGAQIDGLAARLADQMRKQHGIGVEMSRAQVVQSLVTSALKSLEETTEESTAA